MTENIERNGNSKNIWNFVNASFNLINTIIGVGIVTLPKIINLVGIPMAIVLSLLCCIITVYTSDLLVYTAEKMAQNKNKEQVRTYAELCEEAIGPFAFYIMAGIIFSMMFCAMGVYGVILRQMVGSIVSDFLRDKFQYERLAMVGMMLVLALPLCFMRDISMLGYTSLLSSSLVFCIIIIVAVQSPKYNDLMKNLTAEQMLLNEVKLNVDRSIWICGKMKSRAPLYTAEMEEFDFRRVTNYNELYTSLAKDGICPSTVKPKDVINAIKSLKVPLAFSTDESKFSQPSDWSEAVSQAHAMDLYSKFSLNKGIPGRLSFLNIIRVLGIFSGAFIIQQATFEIYGQLKPKTLRRWRLVQFFGYPVVYFLNMTLAFSGFLSQRHQVGELVFDKMKMRFYEADGSFDIATNVGRIFLAVTILLTFPMQNYFARRNFFVIFFSLLRRCSGKDYNPVHPPSKYFYPFTILQFGLALIIGIYLDSIIIFYIFIGSMFAAPLIYVLPILCYLRLGGSIRKRIKETFKSKSILSILKNVLIPVTILSFGVILTLVGTATTIYDNLIIQTLPCRVMLIHFWLSDLVHCSSHSCLNLLAFCQRLS